MSMNVEYKHTLTDVVFRNLTHSGEQFIRISFIFGEDFEKDSHHIQFRTDADRGEVVGLLRSLSDRILSRGNAISLKSDIDMEKGGISGM